LDGCVATEDSPAAATIRGKKGTRTAANARARGGINHLTAIGSGASASIQMWANVSIGLLLAADDTLLKLKAVWTLDELEVLPVLAG
jgi:predicted TIM-barrel enzyme